MKTHFFKNFSSEILGIYPPSYQLQQSIPLYTNSVHAGFPSPADDYLEKELDLNELIVQHPAATFYVKVQGHSMQSEGIFSGDILVVDRSLTAYNKNIIIAVLDGEFTVKRLVKEENNIYLISENNSDRRIKINPESQFEVWGVVTYVIHKTY